MGYENNQYWSQNIKDIRSEPQDAKGLYITMLFDCYFSVKKLFLEQKLSKDGLQAFRRQLNYVHGLAMQKGDDNYFNALNRINDQLDAFDQDANFWQRQSMETNKDNYLEYYVYLEQLIFLAFAVLPKFNLMPAEDESFIFPDLPYEELGIDTDAALS